MSDRQPWELEDDEVAEIEHDAHDVCSRCEGEGQLWADGLMHYYDPNRPTKACPNCDGTGRVVSGNEGRDVATAAQKRLVEYVLKRGRWEDSWHFILTKDKVDVLKAALEVE